MKLTLRKASTLQLAINEQIAAEELVTAVIVGRYDDPIKVTTDAITKFTNAKSKKLHLLRILAMIRSRCASESEKAGISAILCEMAHFEKVISILKPLSEIKDFLMTHDALQEAHADLKKETTQQSNYPYSKRDSFQSGVLISEWTEDYKKQIADLKKQKQVLSDKLLELNVQHSIELSDPEEEALKGYGII